MTDPRADWPAYFKAARSFDVRPTTRLALSLFAREGTVGHAIDLGCGNGTDTLALLEAGWAVTALDASAEGLADLRQRVPAAHADRLTLRQIPMQEAVLPPCLLLNASFALPFCPPEAFADVWGRIVGCLPTGGRFAGQLFGPQDSWHAQGYALTHTHAEVADLLTPFEVDLLREDARPGTDALGKPKFWHVWHIVARKII
jgi:trans-aconitate methyltransferase